MPEDLRHYDEESFASGMRLPAVISSISGWRSEVFRQVLDRVALGSTVRNACTLAGTDEATVGRWRYAARLRGITEPDEAWKLAMARRSEMYLEELHDLRDDANDRDSAAALGQKLAVRSKLMAWGDPARFGDHKTVSLSGGIEVTGSIDESLSRARQQTIMILRSMGHELPEFLLIDEQKDPVSSGETDDEPPDMPPV